jgi:hypothetical protein
MKRKTASEQKRAIEGEAEGQCQGWVDEGGMADGAATITSTDSVENNSLDELGKMNPEEKYKEIR